MAAVELIYCADGNARHAEIAINHGFLYGALLPKTIYFPPYFADQDFKRPNFSAYLEAIKQHRPSMVSILDWMEFDQLPDILAQAEELAPLVDTLMLIPKVDRLDLLPKKIGGKPVRLGYSVPTKFGGTLVPYHSFDGWPVHLLGGSPQQQRRLTRYLNVVSVDGNMHNKMANQYGAFFDPTKSTSQGYWPTVKEWDGKPWGNGKGDSDLPYEAFRRSCVNIQKMWGEIIKPKYQMRLF